MIFAALCTLAFGRIEAPAPVKHQPVKLDVAKQVVQRIGIDAVCRAVQTTPIEYRDSVGEYFRKVGFQFCQMPTSGDFTYSALEKAVNEIPSPLITDTYFLDVKSTLLSLYKLSYADRLRAEIPPNRWLEQISQVFCESISEGLKDAGKAGVN